MNIDPTRNVDATVRALGSGDVRACARIISRIERNEEDLIPLLQAAYRAGGRCRVIGITGPPGAGKSSLVSRLIGIWRRRELRVAVLAVDPSSPFSGGAVLGDRLRMAEHSCDDGVFIRSMASRGRLGGLAKATGDALTVLDAMPWDVVVVETVGVGQSETDIMRHAAAVVLLQTPMGGDDVQAAKAGINEIGDIYVVNKSDHPDADRTFRQLEQMIALSDRLHPGRTWRPPVVKTQALLGEGVEALVDHIESRFTHLESHLDIARQQLRDRVRHRAAEIVRDMLDRRMRSEEGQLVDALIDAVVARDSDPYALAAGLLASMK